MRAFIHKPIMATLYNPRSVHTTIHDDDDDDDDMDREEKRPLEYF